MDSFEYDGTNKKPIVSVKDSNNGIVGSESYSIFYPESSVNVDNYTLKVEFKGNYIGELSKNYEIKPTSLSMATVNLENTSIDYDGTAKCPNVTVSVNNNELKPDTDYTIEYSNNINAGTATVKVLGKNNYKGEVTKTFDISDEFDITYYLDGGINDVLNSSIYKSSEGLILNNPKKTGYIFKGWYTEDKFENIKNKISIGEFGDISLFAKWEAIPVVSPSHFENSTITILVGDKKNSGFVNPTNMKSEYFSSDSRIAKVDRTNGIITAVKKGITTVTAKVDGKNYYMTVIVNKPNVSGKSKVKKGKTIVLSIKDANAKITWKSSDKKIATIDKNGIVKGKKQGVVTITAKYNGKKFTKKITVK